MLQALAALQSQQAPVARTLGLAHVRASDGLVPACMSTQVAAACVTGSSADVPEDLRPCSQVLDVKRFDAHDRNLLAAEAGIGARVIERMEEAGFHNLAQLRAAGSAQVVDVVCRRLGSIAWRNRLRPLERALVRADERTR